jgi:hypothetical protein
MAVPVRSRTDRPAGSLDIEEYTDPENDPMIPHTLVLKPDLVVHTTPPTASCPIPAAIRGPRHGIPFRGVTMKKVELGREPLLVSADGLGLHEHEYDVWPEGRDPESGDAAPGGGWGAMTWPSAGL